jgi:transcription-repair coupling factor (superfamily II helicase)
MAPQALEAVVKDFNKGKADILVSTNIIEAGIDIPNANTMLVHRADRFGLAQLYQLRGRIGRSKIRAYAYLTLPAGQILGTAAEKRLAVMQTLDTLGAGFSLASHDLDIRGAGNLLGQEQSGNIKEVGVELYQHMLEEAISAMREERGDAVLEADSWSPQISLGVAVLIPDDFVADLGLRMGLYRRLSHIETKPEIDAFASELIDRFGILPKSVENLLKVMEIKNLCRLAGIEKVDAGQGGASVVLRESRFANPLGLVGYIQRNPLNVKLRPDQSIVFKADWPMPDHRIDGVTRLVGELAEIATQDQAA